MPSGTHLSRTRLVVLACIAGWFLAVLGISLFGLLRTGPSSPPIPIGLALLVPLILGVLAYARSATFRRLLLRADLRWLIGVQLWRIAGGVFLIDYARHQLPASFALPAGVGDVLVGLAAPFVAVVAASGTSAARRIVIGWCVAGIADLVVAVTMGVLNAPGQFGLLAGEVTTAPMLELPLNLLPTFFVPLSILLHLIVLRRSPEIAQLPGAPSARRRMALSF
ncbi:MAG: hypothetical protein JO287_08180 [Pseudonocardiales bacterium]|nr:hypothetical protein [Pseudonocardiales bacterium]